MKPCKDCGVVKVLDDFYKHSNMADGRANKCKECVRLYNIENVERTAKRASKWHKSKRGKECGKARYKKFYNARLACNYFRRNNKEKYPDKCQKCNKESKVEAHHHSYDLPMDVTYLCSPCHIDWHKHNTPLNNKTGIFTENKK